MYLLRGVMHLVHDASVKFAKLWLLLAFALVSATSMLAQAYDYDMTNWRGMGKEAYHNRLASIQPGDTLKYVTKKGTSIFNIEGRLKKAPGAAESFSENFLLDNQKVLQVPSAIVFAQTLQNFMEGHDAFEKAGINVVKVYQESDPENFIIKEYVEHISLRALLYLLVDNNAGFVQYELNRRVGEAEREEMKAETIRFIESLAVITEAHDFGVQQSIYAVKYKKAMVLDFLGVPKFFDPSLNTPQPNVLEDWTDYADVKEYGVKGEEMEGKHHISVKAFKFISNFSERQRMHLSTAFRCKLDLNTLATQKPLQVQKPQGPTGT